SPLTGAVTYLEPMTGRHAGRRVVYASGYLVCPKDGVPHTNVFNKMCSGKGINPDQAKASALCEALERFSGICQGDEAVVRASMVELGPDAVHFNGLQNFSDSQFENRDTLNALTRDRRKWIPSPFDVHTAIDWTPAWTLSRNRKRYVPLSYCYAEAPPESGSMYGTHNPNGAAAGNCLEEAVLQGILELVERDAVAIWWYNKLPRPEIDLAGFRDGYFNSLKYEYARMGWNLWVLDLTHDLSIPVYAALAHHARDKRFTIGFGCHLDAHLAVQRALTEVNQLFDPTGKLQAPWDMSELPTLDFLFPLKDAGPEPPDAFPHLGGPDLKTDIECCVERLVHAGLEVMVVNKTRPDIGLHVVHVMVPGLRHFWPRLGPGRLYSVPRAMGWVGRRLLESDLNPVPLFL
ncbi:MAG: YcaO-like family protein, partial [Desulfatitalea sp.]|nr:YcaO-like family protein [Desulfatitalea sp.]NNK00460.1 YcaO-like family protein [Desulfatitalea sp.]